MSGPIPASVVKWTVVQIWDTEVPEEVLKALKKEQKDPKGYVFSLMWKDLFVYNGEEGWCLNEETLEVCEAWLDRLCKELHIGGDECFYLKIGRS